jgi:hypothetical protein
MSSARLYSTVLVCISSIYELAVIPELVAVLGLAPTVRRTGARRTGGTP